MFRFPLPGALPGPGHLPTTTVYRPRRRRSSRPPANHRFGVRHRFAGAVAGSCGKLPAMDILPLLIGISVLLALAIAGIFVWAVRSGQFDDLDTPAVRILTDDDERPPPH